MAGVMGHFGYPSDDGTTYRVRLDASNAAAGGLTALSAGPALPRGYFPRHLWARHAATGSKKRIVCAPDNANWTGDSGGNVTLTDTMTQPSTEATYIVEGRIGERRFAL